mmetsp:Transcript_33644/g.66174  ORF Transcript_33644/g.66174 Transcript_33644/m.66174 type:complete len:239 (-) Transcript_33644:313-1029(-)
MDKNLISILHIEVCRNLVRLEDLSIKQKLNFVYCFAKSLAERIHQISEPGCGLEFKPQCFIITAVRDFHIQRLSYLWFFSSSDYHLKRQMKILRAPVKSTHVQYATTLVPIIIVNRDLGTINVYNSGLEPCIVLTPQHFDSCTLSNDDVNIFVNVLFVTAFRFLVGAITLSEHIHQRVKFTISPMDGTHNFPAVSSFYFSRFCADKNQGWDPLDTEFVAQSLLFISILIWKLFPWHIG